MDREHALAQARGIVARDRLGPPDYRQAASFGLDEETQTFVELEGGGKEAFTQMMRDGLYAAYTWRVRHFAEGQSNETTIQFTPDGHPYGFDERLDENGPGRRAASRCGASHRRGCGARELAGGRRRASRSSSRARSAGRAAASITPSPTSGPRRRSNEGRYRLELVVVGRSADRASATSSRSRRRSRRRYENMRSANEAIGVGSAVGMVLLYVFGGIGVGLFFMLRRRRVLWRQPLVWGVAVAFLQALAAINEWPLLWMSYDTAVPRTTFFAQQCATIGVTFLGFSVFFALSFMAAETLTRAAFGDHPQFWRVWSRGSGSSTAILGRTVGGYLLVSLFFAYDVLLYLFTTRVVRVVVARRGAAPP